MTRLAAILVTVSGLSLTAQQPTPAVQFEIASVKVNATNNTFGSFADMFTAFREQLGLTLEPQIAPHEVLVIDQVQMPTPD